MKKFLLPIIAIFVAGLGFSQSNQLIIGANNNDAIISALLDGSAPTEINTGQGSQSFYNGVYNSTDGKVYMSWYYGIYSMNVDGSDFLTLYSYPSGGMGDGIDVDEANGHVYFTNSQIDSIMRMDLGGNNLTGIYGGANVGFLSDVKADVANAHIYFTEWLGATEGVHRIDINGTNEIPIISGVGVENIRLDVPNNHLYYMESSELKRCDLLGASITSIYNGGFQLGGFDLDIPGNFIYMTDMNSHKVFSTDLLGANATDLVLATDISFGGNPLESPQGPILVFNPDLCDVDTSTTTNGMTVSANLAGVTYHWLDCDDNYSIVAGETNQNFTATISGNYAVQITDGACIDTSACVAVSNASLSEYELQKITVSPNPTSGKVNLEFDQQYDNIIMNVLSVDGHLVASASYNATNTIELNIDGAQGVYFVELTLDNKIARIKIVKK